MPEPAQSAVVGSSAPDSSEATLMRWTFIAESQSVNGARAVSAETKSAQAEFEVRLLLVRVALGDQDHIEAGMIWPAVEDLVVLSTGSIVGTHVMPPHSPLSLEARCSSGVRPVAPIRAPRAGC